MLESSAASVPPELQQKGTLVKLIVVDGPCAALHCVCWLVLLQRGLHTPHLATPELQQPGAPPLPGVLSGVAQLLLFLSGSPDIGIGKTVAMTAAGGAPGGGRAAGAAGSRVVGPGAGDISRQVRS